ncbi:MFS transporter, partial [Candidatus Parcubacteria bacterium]|nr:MFS transporter [Candidatus Parcubacteria bacterium]
MKSIYKNLLITSFFISLATTAFPVFLPVYFKELGLSNFEIGASLALLYLTSAILSVFVGYFEEKISKKKILIFSYFGYILLPIFYLNAANLISIFLVRIYDGIVSSLRYVSKYSILESKKSDETGINISLNEALSSVGCLLGPFIAGIVASYYGINMIFIISSIILFFTALYSARMLKFTKNNNFILKKLFHKKTLFLSVLKKLFRKKSLMTLSLIFLLFAIIDHSKFMIIILYMKSLNFNNFFIGLAGSSFFLFLFLFEIFYGYLQKKFKKNKFLALGLLLYSF